MKSLHTKYHFTRIALFVLFASLITLELSGQSLIEKLGGVKTDFIISSIENNLEIEAQYILRKGTSETGRLQLADEGSYGYGYSPFYFEFMTKDNIQIRNKRGRNQEYFSVEFYDAQDQILAQYRWDLESIDIVTTKQEPSYKIYSLNLEGVPMLVLEKTRRINLIEYQLSYRN